MCETNREGSHSVCGGLGCRVVVVVVVGGVVVVGVVVWARPCVLQE